MALVRTLPPYLVPEVHEADLLASGLAFVGKIRAQALREVCALLNVAPPFLRGGDDRRDWGGDRRDWVDICSRLRSDERPRHVRRFTRVLMKMAPDLQAIVSHTCQVLSGSLTYTSESLPQKGHVRDAVRAYRATAQADGLYFHLCPPRSEIDWCLPSSSHSFYRDLRMAEDMLAAQQYAQRVLLPSEVSPWTYECWLTDIAGPEAPPAGTSYGPPRPQRPILEDWAHLNEKGEWCSLRDIPETNPFLVPIGLPALWRGPSDRWWQEKRRAAPSICPKRFVMRGIAPDYMDFLLWMSYLCSDRCRATWPRISPSDSTRRTRHGTYVAAALRMWRAALQDDVRKNEIPEESIPMDRRDLLGESPEILFELGRPPSRQEEELMAAGAGTWRFLLASTLAEALL